MILLGVADSLMFCTFQITLQGATREWFSKLSLKSISFYEMDKETLTSLTKWFNNEVKLVAEASSSILINAYINNLLTL